MTDRMYYSKEAKSKARKQRAMMATFMMLIGAGIGAIMAILFAPQEGEETRDAIKDKIAEGGKAIDDKISSSPMQDDFGEDIDMLDVQEQSAIDKLESKYEDLRNYVNDTFQRVTSMN